MEVWAFVADREPFECEVQYTKTKGIKLVPVTIPNPFTVNWEHMMDAWYEHYQELSSEEEEEYESYDHFQFDGIITDNPAVALNLIVDTSVGIFNVEVINNVPRVERFKIFQ